MTIEELKKRLREYADQNTEYSIDRTSESQNDDQWEYRVESTGIAYHDESYYDNTLVILSDHELKPEPGLKLREASETLRERYDKLFEGNTYKLSVYFKSQRWSDFDYSDYSLQIIELTSFYETGKSVWISFSYASGR